MEVFMYSDLCLGRCRKGMLEGVEKFKEWKGVCLDRGMDGGYLVFVGDGFE